MDTIFKTKIAEYARTLGIIVGTALAVFAFITYSATKYSPGALLQPNDITTSHIREGTIQANDVNTNSGFSLSGLAIGSSSPYALVSIEVGTKTPTFVIADKGTTSPLLTINQGETPRNEPSVGIGTSSPGARFSVYGSALIAGTTTTNNLVATGTIRLNNVSYTFPSADGTNAQVLSTNGAGTLSWTAVGGSTKLCSATTTVTVTNTAVESVLLGCNMTAGQLGASDSIYIHLRVSDLDHNTNSLTLRMYLGATSIATGVLSAPGANNNAGILTGVWTAKNATNSQAGHLNTLIVNEAWLGSTCRCVDASGTAVEDTTTALPVRFTAQWAGAATNDSITVNSGYIEIIK